MIPTQLKEMAFCRVRKSTKKPYENGWQNIYYTYEQIQNYFPQENYGVLTGINGFGALDDDTEEKVLLETYNKNFPETMQVRGHYYLTLKGWSGKKIIFYVGDKHLGELQGLGQQVVGAGSTHPSGETYKLVKDIPIVEIEYSRFIKVFDKYIRKPKELRSFQEVNNQNNNPFLDEVLSAVSMEKLLGDIGIDTTKNPTDCPFHDSKGGKCLGFQREVAHCFHCDGSWNIFSLAMQHKGTDFVGALEWICDKYGLRQRLNHSREQVLDKPKGWALSVSITRLAERHEFKACPICKGSFEFIESHGFFECRNCKTRGGLKKFAELISDKVGGNKND